jgi:nitrogen-specific signal transduction histidine kinase
MDGIHLKQILSNRVLIAVEITGDGDGEISLAVDILPEARALESKPFPSDRSRRSQNLSASRSQIQGKRLPWKTSIRFLILSSRPGLLGGDLGLSTVLGLVRVHEGAIAVKSAVRGSTFKVYFPLSDRGAPASPDDEALAATSNGSRVGACRR